MRRQCRRIAQILFAVRLSPPVSPVARECFRQFHHPRSVLIGGLLVHGIVNVGYTENSMKTDAVSVSSTGNSTLFASAASYSS